MSIPKQKIITLTAVSTANCHLKNKCALVVLYENRRNSIFVSVYFGVCLKKNRFLSIVCLFISSYTAINEIVSQVGLSKNDFNRIFNYLIDF